MPYTDPSTLTFATNENPLASSKLNQATNDQFSALFPDGAAGVAWSPTLEATTTDPGSTVAGRRFRVGPLEFVWALFTLTSGGSGTYFVTLPSTVSGLTASASSGAGQRLGGFHIKDTTPPYMAEGSVLLRSSTTVHFHATSEVGDTASGVVSHDNPREWASGDILSFYAMYLTA